MEYQRVDRQLQHCQKIYTAWKYVNAKEQSRNADKNVEEIKEKVRGMEQSITDATSEAEKIDEKVEEIKKKKEAVSQMFVVFFYRCIVIFVIFLQTKTRQ